MEEVLEAVLAILNANGGSIEYAQLVESLDFQYRSRVYDALRYGKKSGVLTKSMIRNEDGSLNHTIALVGSG